MATLQEELELINRTFGSPAHDNSALRARLGGQQIAQRSIEAELRAAMAERDGSLVIDLRDEVVAV